MNKFFQELVNKKMLNKSAEALDWILDDSKFNVWPKNTVRKFTNKLNKLPGLKKDNFIYGSSNTIDYNNIDNSIRIVISGSGNKGRDLCRHLRNGIAHGHAKLLKIKNKCYVEIKDYQKKDFPNNQTAYFLMPFDYIEKIYKCYKDVDKSVRNDRNNFSRIRKAA